MTDVVCVDSFFTGIKHNIRHLLGHPRFEPLRHHVAFPLYVEVDEFYNLFCPMSPVHYQHDPVQATKTTSGWTATRLCVRRPCRCAMAKADGCMPVHAGSPVPEAGFGVAVRH